MPNHSLELNGSVLQTGFADPGLTYAAIMSSIALATEGELAMPRSGRRSGIPRGHNHRGFIRQPLGSTARTTSSSRPDVLHNAARRTCQGRPRGPPRQRLGLAKSEPGATLPRFGKPGIILRLPPPTASFAGRSRPVSSPPKRRPSHHDGVEQQVLGALGPRIAPPLESGHPKVAEAARLMREAAEVSDPADLYEIEDIVAAVPAMLVDALPDLRLADKRVVRGVLAAMEGEGAEQEVWRAWHSAELMRRLAIMLCIVGNDS